VKSIAALPDGARAYAPFQQAGAVLYYGAPRGVTIFYDSRNDCYSPETARTFFAIERGSASPDEALAALEESGTNAALVPRNHLLLRPLESRWRPVAEHGRWRLFLR
jgi:hypothetical protein